MVQADDPTIYPASPADASMQEQTLEIAIIKMKGKEQYMYYNEEQKSYSVQTNVLYATGFIREHAEKIAATFPDPSQWECQVIDPSQFNDVPAPGISAQLRLMCEIVPLASMSRLILSIPRDIDLFDMQRIPCFHIEDIGGATQVRLDTAQVKERFSLHHTEGRLNYGYFLVHYVKGSTEGTKLMSLPPCRRETRGLYLQKSDQELKTIFQQEIENLLKTLHAIVK